jgi:hypothetical protein
MPVTAMDGAIMSTRTEKPLGQLDTGIGWSSLFASQVRPAGMDLNDQPLEHHIGPASPDQINAVGADADKGLKFLQAGADVAVDAVVSTGWVNKTGRVVKSGEYVMARTA